MTGRLRRPAARARGAWPYPGARAREKFARRVASRRNAAYSKAPNGRNSAGPRCSGEIARIWGRAMDGADRTAWPGGAVSALEAAAAAAVLHPLWDMDVASYI
jgi:hypothetical protein